MSTFDKRVNDFIKELENDKKGSTLAKIKDYFKIITKESDRVNGASYIFKALLSAIFERKETCGQSYTDVLFYLYSFCNGADKKQQQFTIFTIYNFAVKCYNDKDKSYKILEFCHFLNKMKLENHSEYADKVEKISIIVLTILKKDPNFKYFPHATDFIVSSNEFILKTFAEQDEDKLIQYVNAMFDSSRPVFYSLFMVDAKKSLIYFEKLLESCAKIKFSEEKLEELFEKFVDYIDTIMVVAESYPDYNNFLRILQIFKLKEEFSSTCHKILESFVKFYNEKDGNKMGILIDAILVLMNQLSKDKANFSNRTAVEISKVISHKLYYKVSKSNEINIIPLKIIELIKHLMKFVKYCGKDPKICSKCSNTNRHLIESLTTIVVQMGELLIKDKKMNVNHFSLVTFFISYKFQIFEAFQCEDKQLLLNDCVRNLANFLKNYTMSENYAFNNDVKDLLKLLVKSKYQYNIDLFDEAYLMKYIEQSCLKDPRMWRQKINTKLIKIALAYKKDDLVAVKHNVLQLHVAQLESGDEEIKSLDIVSLLEHNDMDKWGLDIDLDFSAAQKSFLLRLQMENGVLYKTTLSPYNIFEKLYKINDNILDIGMSLYHLDDVSIKKVDENVLLDIENRLKSVKLNDDKEELKKFSALGHIKYKRHDIAIAELRKLTKEFHPTSVNIKKDQINGILALNRMDEEVKIIGLLDEALEYLRKFMIQLAATDFQHIEIVSSKTFSCKVFDNISYHYELHNFPKRAMEAQILHYILSLEKNVEDDLFCPLSQLVGSFEMYEIARSSFKKQIRIASLKEIVKKSENLLNKHRKSFNGMKETKRFYYLLLMTNISYYKAVTNDLQSFHDYLKQIDDLLEKEEINEYYGHIIRAEKYYVIYRLLTKHKLCVFGGNLSLSPQIFSKLLINEYNQLTQNSNRYLQVVHVTTLKLFKDVANYQISNYSAAKESYIETVLKFSLKMGLGIRSANILVQYAMIHAIAEDREDFMIKISYLNKILAFEPSAAKTPEATKVANYLKMSPIVVGSQLEPIDAARKSIVMKKSPSKRSSPQLNQNEKVTKNFMLTHQNDCTCNYCKYPQFKILAFQTGCLQSRLLFLTDNYDESFILYSDLYKYWSKFWKVVETDPKYLDFITDFYQFSIRYLLQYSHLLKKFGNSANGLEICEIARDFGKKLGNFDVALRLDVEVNLISYEPLKEIRSEQFIHYDEFMRAVALPSKTPKPVRKFPSKTPLKSDGARVDLFMQMSGRKMKMHSDSSDEDKMKMNDFLGINKGSERKQKVVSVFVDSPKKSESSNDKLKVKKPRRRIVSPKSSTKFVFETPIKKQSFKEVLGSCSANNDFVNELVFNTPPTEKPTSLNDSYKDVLIKSLKRPPATISNSSTESLVTVSKTENEEKFVKIVRKEEPKMESIRKKHRGKPVNPKAVPEIIVIEDSDDDFVDSSFTGTKTPLLSCRKKPSKENLDPNSQVTRTQLEFQVTPIKKNDDNNNKEEEKTRRNRIEESVPKRKLRARK